jgi:hypothetical protein
MTTHTSSAQQDRQGSGVTGPLWCEAKMFAVHDGAPQTTIRVTLRLHGADSEGRCACCGEAWPCSAIEWAKRALGVAL